MAKKKTTLPKNFDEMMRAGDIEELKAVFDKCEFDATGGFNKGTALHFYGIPGELVSWLAEQGANIEAENSYGRTPLYIQASIGSDNVKLLLELGADIEAADRYGETALHIAAGFYKAETVGLLIERGANIHKENESGQTPLSYGLERCQNTNISGMAEVAKLLLDAGAKITPDMAESVLRIGKTFEFHREGFNKDLLRETEEGLARLYELFGVTPVAKRRVHDGLSPITAAAADWQGQHNELWEFLVPSQGPAQTVQGEVIRITGRISDETYRNGGCNWDASYRKMLDALLSHFASGAPLSEKELGEAKELAAVIRPSGECDDEPDRLCELATIWVLRNPNPVPLEKPAYNR